MPPTRQQMIAEYVDHYLHQRKPYRWLMIDAGTLNTLGIYYDVALTLQGKLAKLTGDSDKLSRAYETAEKLGIHLDTLA